MNVCTGRSVTSAISPTTVLESTPPLRKAPSGTSEMSRRSTAYQQTALAWLLARSPAILPIPGTSSVAHLEENIAAASLRLSQAEVDELGL